MRRHRGGRARTAQGRRNRPVIEGKHEVPYGFYRAQQSAPPRGAKPWDHPIWCAMSYLARNTKYPPNNVFVLIAPPLKLASACAPKPTDLKL